MTTLYVTDLDGTLLRPDGTLAESDRQVLDRLVRERKLLLTYATARPHRAAAQRVGTNLWRLPVIVHNGAFTVDPATGTPLRSHLIPAGAVATILEATAPFAVTTIVFSRQDGRERVQWVRDTETTAMNHYLTDRPGDPRFDPVPARSLLTVDGVFAISAMGTDRAVAQCAAAVARCDPSLSRSVSRETYHPGDHWLHITTSAADKASEALQLAATLSVDRLVCFGDNHNDLPLFAAADEAYAVANAAPDVRAAATAILASNRESGVVRWLESHT